MRYIAVFVAIVALGRVAAAQDAEAPPTAAVISDCIVAAAQQADLPPNEAGVLLKINAREGQQVAAKDNLLQLDDRKARADLEVAKAKAAAAATKVKASNVNIEYSESAYATAQAELDVSKKANQDVPGTIPAVKINELQLKVTETRLSIVKARLDKEVAEKEAETAAAETRAADVLVERHQVVSPIGGEVQEVRAHEGEYVQPTLAIMHVVRLDQLWVEGSASAAKYARNELAGRPVKIDVVLARGQKATFPGRVIFVKAEIEAGNKFLVRAEVDNRKANGAWVLSPGMRAVMTIELGPAVADAGTR